ncbi:MAG: hypothetical protein PHD43_19510 [Methylococcales bacterium]|nr:hypothetical protein [Methylococcales bacterium]
MTDIKNNDYLWQRRYDVKVRALMNRMYYQERQRIFEWREGFIKAASILAGSIAFANVTDPEIIKWCAVFITAASTFSLVFGYGNKARDSVKRSAEWAQLERDIEQVGERDFTEENINQWFARANDIEAGEPAAHRILLERSYERAVEILGGEAEIKFNCFKRHFPPIMVP